MTEYDLNIERDSLIIIVSPFSYDKVLNPRAGGYRLIREQILSIRSKGVKVILLSLPQYTTLSTLLLKIKERFFAFNLAERLDKNVSHRSIIQPLFEFLYRNTIGQRIRWIINSASIILSEFITNYDIKYKHSIQNIFYNAVFRGYNRIIVIYNTPYGLKPFIDMAKNFKKRGIEIKIFLYEHNIEWEYFQDKLGNSLLEKALVHVLRAIELMNTYKVDYVLTTSEDDKNTLIRNGIPSLKVKVWIPLDWTFAYKKRVSSEICRKIGNSYLYYKELKNNKIKVICFLGSLAEHNIIAVKNIFKIATQIRKDIVFLIFGSVKKAFENYRFIPSNVKFMGYVDDLFLHLCLCDAFINPKTTSATGIEVKNFDYLLYDKPIISTEIGARGFKGIKNIIIVSIEEMPKIIESLMSEKSQ